MTATIQWGDGQTSQGNVGGSNGSFTVSGDHVYLHPGALSLQVAVTDPTGATTVSTATASVTPVPLTVIDNILSGVVAGQSATFTVATFTDGNTYDTAGSYAATIGWGDGSSSQGIVDGGDGVYRVVGDHTYAANGTSNVVVTVTDVDGTTATAAAPSRVVGGDINAGVVVNLTVASFTSANPYLTASDFQATINWGDGSGNTWAYVAGSAGSFTVSGQHAYAVAGTYTAQVQVTGGGGTLSASNTIAAAPAPAGTIEGAIATTVGGPLNNLELALLTLPNGGGAGSYTGMAFWGDGTSSAITLVQNSVAVLEAWGSHAYATAGLFSVKTLIYNAANSLVAAVVSMVVAKGIGVPAIFGPVVVPGNSVFTYWATIPDTLTKNLKANAPQWKTSDATLATLGSTGHQMASLGTPNAVSGFGHDIVFANKAGEVTITLEPWGPLQNPVTLTVTVVQVKVDNPPNEIAFDPSQGLKDNGQQTHPESTGRVTVNGQQQQRISLATIETTGVNPDGSTRPAIAWQAQITLIGPNGTKDLDHIKVGFHQTEHTITDRGVSGTNGLKSNREGQTYLDAMPASAPWLDNVPSTYTPKTPAILSGTAVPTIIANDDTPTLKPIVAWVEGSFSAQKVERSSSFVVSVAAATTDQAYSDGFLPAVLDEPPLFQEAYAGWSFNANGTISTVLAGFVPKLRWTPDMDVKISGPTGNNWTLTIPKVVQLLTQGPLARQASIDRTWSKI